MHLYYITVCTQMQDKDFFLQLALTFVRSS